MLINTPYKTDDIVTFKIITGEEIIASYQGETDAVFKISRPLALAMHGQGIGLIPAAFSAPLNNIELQKRHVLMHDRTREELVGNYIEGTTGIQTVRKGNILT
jgi:hypothetical protein